MGRSRPPAPRQHHVSCDRPLTARQLRDYLRAWTELDRSGRPLPAGAELLARMGRAEFAAEVRRRRIEQDARDRRIRRIGLEAGVAKPVVVPEPGKRRRVE